MPKFLVRGTDTITGKARRKTLVAQDADEAQQQARDVGIGQSHAAQLDEPKKAAPAERDRKLDARIHDNVVALGDCAQAKLTARIVYQKPWEDRKTARVVEPYQLLFNREDLIIMTWQLEPGIDPAEGTAWRNFRADRILSVARGDRMFVPRAQITLGTGEATQFTMQAAEESIIRRPSPELTYIRHLDDLLLDGVMTEEESATALRLSSVLTADRVKAVHAQVYANLLMEVARDGSVSAEEEDMLGNVRVFLGELGWCP